MLFALQGSFSNIGIPHITDGHLNILKIGFYDLCQEFPMLIFNSFFFTIFCFEWGLSGDQEEVLTERSLSTDTVQGHADKTVFLCYCYVREPWTETARPGQAVISQQEVGIRNTELTSYCQPGRIRVWPK